MEWNETLFHFVELGHVTGFQKTHPWKSCLLYCLSEWNFFSIISEFFNPFWLLNRRIKFDEAEKCESCVTKSKIAFFIGLLTDEFPILHFIVILDSYPWKFFKSFAVRFAWILKQKKTSIYFTILRTSLSFLQ